MEGNTVVLTGMLLQLLAIVILAGVVCAKLSQKINIPDVVLFILAGVILGPHILNIVNIDKYPLSNQLILTIGAAYILYDGGREIELKILNKVKVSVLILATLGVLISTFITGFFASKIFGINMMYALLVGSVIASTDPSVLVPLFKNMNISSKLKQTIISESAFNDAAGAIITFSLIGMLSGQALSIGGTAFALLKSAGGGILVGVIIGLISTKLISAGKYGFLKEFSSEVSLVSVIQAYLISEHFGFSGFMSVFILGMICGNKKMLNCHVPEEYFITNSRFKEVLTIILRMMIFVLLGTHIQFDILGQYWKGALLVVIILIFVARPISVLISTAFDRKAQWTFREKIYLMWIRETGVIPAALAGMLVATKFPNSDIVSSVTFMTIIITLTLQASTSKLLARALKLED